MFPIWKQSTKIRKEIFDPYFNKEFSKMVSISRRFSNFQNEYLHEIENHIRKHWSMLICPGSLYKFFRQYFFCYFFHKKHCFLTAFLFSSIVPLQSKRCLILNKRGPLNNTAIDPNLFSSFCKVKLTYYLYTLF